MFVAQDIKFIIVSLFYIILTFASMISNMFFIFLQVFKAVSKNEIVNAC